VQYFNKEERLKLERLQHLMAKSEETQLERIFQRFAPKTELSSDFKAVLFSWKKG
jgi:hypothetical protein